MIWLLTRPVVWPVKASAYSLAAGYKTGRFVGLRRITVFLLGIGFGLLVAPVPGRDLRAMLQERLAPSPQPPSPPPPSSPPPSSPPPPTAPSGPGADVDPVARGV